MPEYKFHLGNIENFELTPYEPRTVGSFGAGKKALVIGAGGGLEMRFLRDQGFKDITAIEINEDIYNLMLGKFSESSGKIFNESRYIRGEGRNFVEAHNDLYDVIVINYIGAVGGMLSSSDDLSENYLFTGEAFETYYKRLKPGGLVIIGLVYSKHLFPNPLLLRTTEAAAWVLRNHNENPKEQMWILGDKRKSISMEDRAYRGIVVLRKGPLQPQEESFIDDMKTGLYFPDSYFVSKPSDSKGVLASLLVSQEELTREAVNSSKIEQAREQEEVDVSVVSDKRPYFFFYESQASFPMRQSQGIFWATCILMGIIIVLLLKDKSGILKESSQGWLLGISGLLGFTYGLLEIALLNAFTIAFSSTLWNFGMMVFGLLLGSVLAGFAGGLLSRVIKLALIVVASFSLILLFWFDLQKFILAWEGEVARSVILIGMTLAISFGLSMLYPQLLKQCEGREPRMPGLLLGVNSAFFILGCIVCRYTAVNLTLRHAFLIAGAVYLLATALFYLKKDFKSAK